MPSPPAEEAAEGQLNGNSDIAGEIIEQKSSDRPISQSGTSPNNEKLQSAELKNKVLTE